MPFRVELVVNENRSSVLSMRHKKLSVHKMFLNAPEAIVKEVANYARGKKPAAILRTFIQEVHPDEAREFELEPKGEVYDLQAIMDEINLNYFEGKLALRIGWFGQKRKRCRQITMGQYFDKEKAIRIHTLLDDHLYPRFFVAFVVYHEMLHSVIPGYYDKRGYFRVHGPEFKQREREFHFYKRARTWEKTNKEKIFGWA